MKLARFLALLVAAALAAFLVWRMSRPEETSPGPGGPVGGTRAATKDWSPETAPRAPDPPPSTATPAAIVTAAPPSDVVPVGTPVTPGQAVDVALPWRAGTGKMRYEITDVTVERDQANEAARNESQRTWRVTVEVLEGDGTGPVRFRLTPDSIRDQILGPDGRIWDYDSVAGDPGGLLDDPMFGAGMKALLPILGKSIEFRLDADGRAVDVDGVDEWRRVFLDAAEHLHPWLKHAAPTRASVLATWGEYLFPVLGGGTMKAGEPRPYFVRQLLIPPWEMVWKGTLDVARDDADAFRVEATADPSIDKGSGQAVEGAPAAMKAVAAPGTAYKAGWRFARTGTPGLLEARIDVKCTVVDSQGEGGAVTWRDTLRRANIRRTHPAAAVK